MSEDQLTYLLKHPQPRRDFLRKGLFSLATWPFLIGHRAVEYVSKPGAPLITRASFMVENGRRGVQKI